jgi:hypothetical protein
MCLKRFLALLGMTDREFARRSTFLGMIDRILGNLNRQILRAHFGLATQTRERAEPPGFVEHIFFVFIQFIERIKPLAHDDVASGAGADHLARVLNFNVVLEQVFADAHALLGLDACALRAEFWVGEDGNGWHIKLLHRCECYNTRSA